jgi:predicted ATP-grasp superfamily ATP-dependent carboligase
MSGSDAYVLHGDHADLHATTLVVMLDGWIDASAAANGAMQILRDRTAATHVATFSSELFIDYRARRPVLSMREGEVTALRWPSIELFVGTSDDGQDLALLCGPEPDAQWRRFVEEVLGLVEPLGLDTVVELGAYPFATPHSRPARLSVTSPSPELLASVTYLRNSLDVPAGAGAALEVAAHDRGIRAFGLWAQVPHYLSAPGYPPGSLALLQGLRETTSIDVDVTALAADAEIHLQRLDQLVAANDEHAAMVAQMEAMYDASLQQNPAIDAAQIPSGEQLAAEFERFLRDQGRQ